MSVVELQAPVGPVQLTFDRFITNPEPQYLAHESKLLSRSGGPRFNPLVVRGVEGAGAWELLDAMRATCLRLAPGMVVSCERDLDLRAADKVAGLLEPHLVLLDRPVGIAGRALNRTERLLHERIAANRLTVLALAAGQGVALLKFCRRAFPDGLVVELMPPGADTRREILMRHLGEHDMNVEDAASAALTRIPWQSADDVRSLGEQLVHAAYSRGGILSAAMVRKLCESLGRRGLDISAAPQHHPCCRYRLRALPDQGRWPADAQHMPAPDETKTAFFRFHCRSVEMRVRRWRDRLLLELRADHEGRVPSRFELDLHLQPCFSLKTRSRKDWRTAIWGMTAGLPRLTDDAFLEARQWVFSALVPRCPRGWRGKRHARQGGLSETMCRVREALREVAVGACQILDKRAHKVALRFPNHIRPWLYQRIVEDETGRLAQVAGISPGVLTFAYAMGKFGGRSGMGAASRKLLRDVVAGRSLNHALDDAVAAWAAGAGRVALSLAMTRAHRLVWERVARASPEELRSIMKAQRLLIRRASAAVPSYTLWIPPPLCFAPEDIPRQKLANARWFRMVKGHDITMAPPTAGPVGRAHDFSAFVSRHAAALESLAEKRCTSTFARHRIQEMLDYARAMDEFPQRSTAPERYLDAVEAWHKQMAELEQLADAAELLGKPLTDAEGRSLVLPAPPCPGWRCHGDEILPLGTAEEVLVEGNRMKNCVLSRLPEVVNGRSSLYHGEAAGHGLTIQIEASPWGVRLVEAHRAANQDPTAAQKRALADFIRHFGQEAKCNCRQVVTPALTAVLDPPTVVP